MPRPSGLRARLCPLAPRCELLQFWQTSRRSTPLAVPKTSLGGKFPCLVSLPPTGLEWLTGCVCVSVLPEWRPVLDFPQVAPEGGNPHQYEELMIL